MACWVFDFVFCKYDLLARMLWNVSANSHCNKLSLVNAMAHGYWIGKKSRDRDSNVCACYTYECPGTVLTAICGCVTKARRKMFVTAFHSQSKMFTLSVSRCIWQAVPKVAPFTPIWRKRTRRHISNARPARLQILRTSSVETGFTASCLLLLKRFYYCTGHYHHERFFVFMHVKCETNMECCLFWIRFVCHSAKALEKRSDKYSPRVGFMFDILIAY